MEWLTSGLRRDVCVLLYAEERRAQKLKSALEARYDRRVKPDRFYGALETLESKGFVEKRVEGLEDVYSLTDAGERSVEVQFAWMRDHVDGETDA
jgi:DNA-binding PadR family transcriptional regulator